MAPLGPWQPRSAAAPIAVAASGGADSTALALLAARWAAPRGLALLSLVVDHGLRPESATEAVATAATLRAIGIDARLLALDGLQPGPAVARRARIARYDALIEACATAGAVDLLLGHHAGDQAETVLMRARAGSRADGLAGMASLLETRTVRLLRPLLGTAPSRLRQTLLQAGLGWIEDPSNRDERAQRTRVRRELSADGASHAVALLESSRHHGAGRMRREAGTARTLALSVQLRPEGFALLPPGLLPAAAVAALIRTIGAASYPPPRDAIERLLQRPRPFTLAGTRLLPAGRLGPGWLLVREAAAIGAPVPARPGSLWDRRYRLQAPADLPDRLEVSALGPDRPPGLARRLPAAILATLPAIRCDGVLVAVPHLGWSVEPALAGLRFRLQPPHPAAVSSLFIAA